MEDACTYPIISEVLLLLSLRTQLAVFLKLAEVCLLSSSAYAFIGKAMHILEKFDADFVVNISRCYTNALHQ
jgi:hypothetical protein